jgi:site-specific DNA-methyltransferase (adenine-specific)
MAKLPDNYYDLAIADPEQGKKQHGGINRSGFVKQSNGSKLFVQDGNYLKKDWDNKPASNQYFDELIRVSKHQIIWGEQYFDRYFGKGRIVWDKVNGNSDQYDCEIAYCSLNDRTELFRYMWSGMMQGKSFMEGHIMQGNKNLNEKRIHPTQKPVALYLWTFIHYDIPKEWKIFDPNLGSGSIGIACDRLGYDLDACENDFEMFSRANSRLLRHQEKTIINPTLFPNSFEKAVVR